MTYCVKCFVSGRVQGVWYRSGTQQQALALGVTGYARNLPDGRVEVLACGSEQSVARFKEWLWQGPSAADVVDVTCQEAAVPPPGDFGTR